VSEEGKPRIVGATRADGKGFVTVEECAEFSRQMERKYAAFLRQRSFETKVRKDARGIYATVTLRNASGSYFYPVEGRVAHLDHDLSERAAALFVLDYIEAYFAEYFREDGGVFLPIDWADYECDGIPLQLKGQILNLEVEKMADELLAGEGPGLDA
jgi:hypothetical protein